MPFPIPVAAKFDFYTWACHELLRRLPDIRREATSQFSVATCRDLFDHALQDVFRLSSATDKHVACVQFGDRLRQDAQLLREGNDRLAEILADIARGVGNIEASWNGVDDLERFHRQGRELARQLFANTSWAITQERLDRNCQLVPEYDTRGAAPLAYRALKGDTLIVRFDFQYGFDQYLAYPYWFLHEYSAHVFASDNGRNELFNDGWMLHVAHVFLRRQWNRGKAPRPLDRAQVDIFEDRFYSELRPDPREGCLFARILDAWLLEESSGRFMALTYEMAAVAFDRAEDEHLPTRFLHTLAHALDADPEGLRQALAATTTARALLAQLVAP